MAAGKDWLSYYVRKRIIHQWTQISLLAETEARKVLEIGPGGGLVTAMALNAGYDVTVLDFQKGFSFPDVPYICGNIIELSGDCLSGFDALVCCEMLEHVPYEETEAILKKYHDSKARYLIVSVPYMAFQLTFEFYMNMHTVREYFSLKKFLFLRKFKKEPDHGHQWEIGYRGYSLKDWERKLQNSGYRILKREFTGQCRSVFHLLERLPA